MSDLRQMPLFPDEPTTPKEITYHTAFNATLNLFRQHLLKEGKSEHTLKAFLSDLALVDEYLDGSTPVGQFTTTDLNHFLNWLENERGVPCSRKSYARRVTTLKVYFKWLHSLGVIEHDPARPVLQRSGPAPLADVLSQTQIDDSIRFSRSMTLRKDRDIQDYRPELILRLLLDTGIKKGEMMKLTLKDIDRLNPARPVLYIRQKSRNVYKERHIKLDSEWLKLLDLYLQQYAPPQTIITCTARNLEYILEDIGNGIELPFKLSFESLRWTSAVIEYRRGMEDTFIREKLGLSEASWHETGSKIRQLSERLDAGKVDQWVGGMR